MIHSKIQAALNKQIQAEADSSQYYLAMASWAEKNGLGEFPTFSMIILMKSVNTCSNW